MTDFESVEALAQHVERTGRMPRPLTIAGHRVALAQHVRGRDFAGSACEHDRQASIVVPELGMGFCSACRLVTSAHTNSEGAVLYFDADWNTARREAWGHRRPSKGKSMTLDIFISLTTEEREAWIRANLSPAARALLADVVRNHHARFEAAEREASFMRAVSGGEP